MSNSSVFVVQEPTGLWVAGCCDTRCGWGMHTVAECETEPEARRAATKHRKEIAAAPPPVGAPAAICPTCGQRTSKEIPS